MFIKTPQQSERVTLRPFYHTDIALWDRWDNDPEVQEYMPEPHTPMSFEEQEQYLTDCQNSENEIHTAIVDRETNTTIGTISITGINEHHGVGELGVVIGDKQFLRKGYGFEAVQLFLYYLQNETLLNRISAECEEENIPMQKIFEKLGFTKECIKVGSRVKKGVRINTVQCSILFT